MMAQFSAAFKSIRSESKAKLISSFTWSKAALRLFIILLQNPQYGAIK